MILKYLFIFITYFIYLKTIPIIGAMDFALSVRCKFQLDNSSIMIENNSLKGNYLFAEFQTFFLLT